MSDREKDYKLRAGVKSRTVKVDALARVEGEGALYVRVKDGELETVQFKIFEPPRFFESFLKGRHFMEAPDITARICGICPVAYIMSAVHAMEDALDLTIPEEIRELRRLLYCGEWIESHVLHIYMLHAPDFLGLADAIRLAQTHREVVERGLRMKKAGNAIVALLGGREVHPINVRVGGFYKSPTKAELSTLRDELSWGRDAALSTLDWVSKLPFPDLEVDYEFVSVAGNGDYPMNEGRLRSNRGLDIEARDYDAHFEERHVERSNALHSIRKGHGAYHVGPMARYNLHRDKLPRDIIEAAENVGLGARCLNPFKSIVVRAVEVLYAFEEALRVIEEVSELKTPFVDKKPRAASGFAATEAPRGLLYHRYRIDDQGLIEDAKIVPPTSQNQLTIEEDLRRVVEQNLEAPEDELTWRCEQTIRNYDPCISCATHFLKLEVERV